MPRKKKVPCENEQGEERKTEKKVKTAGQTSKRRKIISNYFDKGNTEELKPKQDISEENKNQSFAAKIRHMKLSEGDTNDSESDFECTTLSPRLGNKFDYKKRTCKDKETSKPAQNTSKANKPIRKTAKKKEAVVGVHEENVDAVGTENQRDGKLKTKNAGAEKKVTKKRKSDNNTVVECSETKKPKGKPKGKEKATPARKQTNTKPNVSNGESSETYSVAADIKQDGNDACSESESDDDFMEVGDEFHDLKSDVDVNSGEQFTYLNKGAVEGKHKLLTSEIKSDRKCTKQEAKAEKCVVSMTLPANSTSHRKVCKSKLLNQNDAMAVLLHMEGEPAVPGTSHTPDTGDIDTVADTAGSGTGEMMSESESDADWEDVEDHPGHSPSKSQLPSGPVEITLEAPVLYKKKKRGEFDMKAYVRRQMNRFKKEVAMNLHKVHLLFLVSRCQYLNGLCEDEVVKAQALSVTMVTRELQAPHPRSITDNHVTRILNWINSNYEHLDDLFRESLHDMTSQLRLVLVCVVLLRHLGMLTRFVTSLQPEPFKPIPSKKNTSKYKTQRSSAGSKSSTSTDKVKRTISKVDENCSSSQSSKSVKNSKNSDKSKASSRIKEENSKIQGHSRNRKCTKLKKGVYKDDDDDDADVVGDDDDDDQDFNPEAAEISKDEARVKKKGPTRYKQSKKGKGKSAKKKMDTSLTSSQDDMSDSDFEEDTIVLNTQQLRKTTPSPRNKKILSTDEEEGAKGFDYWVEVYLQKEQKWICVDCRSMTIKQPYDLENTASQPVCYVIGITKEGHIKDITQRYASQWLTETRKWRTDPEWWADTLLPYVSTDTRTDKQEDDQMACSLQQQPLPTTVSAFKNHPLYVLRRHLLKFEAIYPDTAIPVGYIRGEPAYARECVHILHSRENWLKEGRCVRIGEEAYKFVKSRPKWNRPKEDPEAKDLELFGPWQTELYIPPPAVNGKVPRNAHGNVEMFLPSMLPGGTVHLKIPGLNKVAKKLDIDCAPAMVGWDHHCGFSHPLMDGWIVCEEHKETLLLAWDEEQEIIRQKEAQKREKRVYENWRKLIRGLLIKERLKKRFDLVEASTSEDRTPESSTKDSITKKSKPGKGDSSSQQTGSNSEKATDVSHAWPQNRLKADGHTLCTVEQL